MTSSEIVSLCQDGNTRFTLFSSSNGVDFETAVARCQEKEGRQLARIVDSSEYDIVLQMISNLQFGLNDGFWIGLRYNESSGLDRHDPRSFDWVDGS